MARLILNHDAPNVVWYTPKSKSCLLNHKMHPPTWFVLSAEATAQIGSGDLVPIVICTAFAILMVILRLYSRIYSAPGGMKTEDYFVMAALVCE